MEKMPTKYSCSQTEGINLKIMNQEIDFPWKKWNKRKLRLKLESLGLDNTGKWQKLADRLSQYYENLQVNVMDSEWLEADCLKEEQKSTTDLFAAVSILIETVWRLSEKLDNLLIDRSEDSSNQLFHSSPEKVEPSNETISSISSTILPASNPISTTLSQYSPSKPVLPDVTPTRTENIVKTKPPRPPPPSQPLQSWATTPLNPTQQQTKRPNVCYGEKYIANMQQQPQSPLVQQHQQQQHPQQQHPQLPVVPGHKSYAQISSQQEVTTIVSDSMCRSIRVNKINSFLDSQQQKININKYPAATASQIRHYAQYTLNEDHPSQVIIVAGSNDVAYDYGKGHADPDIIAERIMNIARDCRLKDVKYIHISSLIQRQSYNLRPIINNVNDILRRKCEEEHYLFIDNSNIFTSDLIDGLHLNDQGNCKFIGNILDICSSYNPHIYN